MKQWVIVISLCICCVFFYQCEKIEGPYISQEDAIETTVDFPEYSSAQMQRHILAEEYTGQSCSNCPTNGHQPMQRLLEQYGDTLICISIHAGVQAEPSAEIPNDFTTSVGDELYQEFNDAGTPMAVFNRVPYNGQYPLFYNKWNLAIQAIDRTIQTAAIQIITEVNGHQLTIHTKTTILSEQENPIKLALYIVEDSIVSPQIDRDQLIENYIHRHVLRGAVNGTFGTFLNGNGRVEKDKSYMYSKRYSCDVNWDMNHIHVVAILINQTTREILQVAENKVVENR